MYRHTYHSPLAFKMATQLVAATRSSPYSSFSSVSNSNVKTYTQTEILRLRDWCLGRAPSDTGSIRLAIMHSAVCTKNIRPTKERCRRRCERKRKWGKRTGIRTRLRLAPHKPAVPRVFLANASSLVNKMDDVKFLTLKCRPFYLPREFSIVFFTAIYVHARANFKLAMAKQHNAICKQKIKHPESIFIVAGIFDHSCLKTVLPKFD